MSWLSNADEVEQKNYIKEWCRRLDDAMGTADLSTISEMTEGLLNAEDYRNPIRLAVNISFVYVMMIVRVLKQVGNFDSRRIAQSLVIAGCPINHVISERDIVEHMILLGSPVIDEPDMYRGARFSVLHSAILRGDSHLRVVELLLNKGVNPNRPDCFGSTTLSVCLRTPNCLEVLRLLVSRGALADSRILLTAISCQQPREVIQLLMQANVDARVREDRGFADLYTTRDSLLQDQFDYLLDLGIDPNTRNLEGGNVLFSTFVKASLEYLRYLVLVCGVELNARTMDSEKTVLSLTYRFESAEMTRQEYESTAKKIRFCLLRGADVYYTRPWVVPASNEILMLIERKLDKWLDLRLEHIAVREFMDAPVNKQIMSAVYCDNFCASYMAVCKLELVALMDTKLYNDVTLFNILTDSDAKMMAYARNEELLAAFRKFCRMRLFLIYMPFLIERIEQFLYLHRIREAAVKVLSCSLLGITNYAVVQEIAKNMSIRDLFKLSKFNRD